MLNSVPSSSRAIRSRFLARSCTPAVSSGEGAEVGGGTPASFEKGDAGLGLIAGPAQLVELAFQRVDLGRVEEGREAERR